MSHNAAYMRMILGRNKQAEAEDVGMSSACTDPVGLMQMVDACSNPTTHPRTPNPYAFQTPEAEYTMMIPVSRSSYRPIHYHIQCWLHAFGGRRRG